MPLGSRCLEQKYFQSYSATIGQRRPPKAENRLWFASRYEFRYVIQSDMHDGVALHAGAWIETRHCDRICSARPVALHAGAWIETGAGRMPARVAASPSMRGRGSKRCARSLPLQSARVALHAGAWIETRSAVATVAHGHVVALHAGAWIETASPTRRPIADRDRVALHAGAWIETPAIVRARPRRVRRPPCGGVDRNAPIGAATGSSSPSMRGRGSKHGSAAARAADMRSPSMRGRGSKHAAFGQRSPPCAVALHAGAWIETPSRRRAARLPRSPSMRGRGSKHARLASTRCSRRVALHAGAWIETRYVATDRSSAGRRPPCGGVDRNAVPRLTQPARRVVALHAGAWIETRIRLCADARGVPRRPPCGGVDRNVSRDGHAACPAARRPPCGGVDRNWPASLPVGRDVRRPPCGGVDRNARCGARARHGVVALHAGAWIETATRLTSRRRRVSPSMRGRGSKHCASSRMRVRAIDVSDAVALHAGAWIETSVTRLITRRAAGRPPCGGVDRNAGRGDAATAARSPSMRGRGSKRAALAAFRAHPQSPSMRGRGSKQADVSRRPIADLRRPPCGGVDRNVDCRMRRSPCARSRRRSPSMRGRGSKPRDTPDGLMAMPGRPPCGGVDRNIGTTPAACPAAVALHAGAWIETIDADAASADRRRPPCGGVDRNTERQACAEMPASPSMRGRGSKRRAQSRRSRRSTASPSMRGRGSKRVSDAGRCGALVALHAGAWIETLQRHGQRAGSRSPSMRGRGSKHGAKRLTRRLAGRRPPCGGVDRNTYGRPHEPTGSGRPPCGGVDRNTSIAVDTDAGSGRPPCGGVDRNLAVEQQLTPACARRPPCGGVDRNIDAPTCAGAPSVALHAGAWIETCAGRATRVMRTRRPPCGGVDRNFDAPYHRSAAAASPSMRGRGSKLASHSVDGRQVALHAGAWIETRADSPAGGRRPPCGGVDRNAICSGSAVMAGVALHAGAWIETSSIGRLRSAAAVSPSMRGRGSKQRGVARTQRKSARRPPCGGVDRNGCDQASLVGIACVALHAGAWIETRCQSLPISRRAVALHAGAWIETWQSSARSKPALSSPSMRGRGSKQAMHGLQWRSDRVALHAGAWIETSPAISPRPSRRSSPSMRGRGSKPTRCGTQYAASESPSMRGRGSKRLVLDEGAKLGKSPSMRGRGSKPARRS